MALNKKVLLCISGSIAAYKSAFLCRLLIKNGCEVRVVMTQAAKSFISPLTLSTLSGHAVMDNVIAEDQWNSHVELGLWADIMLIAPATANTLARLANGISDNMLTACYLSAKCPVFIAPAMDLDMWRHPSTKKNLNLLNQYGNRIIPVGNGFLASGLEGEGRMAEPDDILQFLLDHFNKTEDLKGKKVLITAGPTHEAIDPVRFIGNRSSGKMGLAIAQECIDRGADVTLVLGPVQINITHLQATIILVQSADDMFKACESHFSKSDIVIFAAAVADYKAATIADKKIKKKSDDMTIELEKTIDISATLGKVKKPNQKIIGFALETNDEIEHALRKLNTKNLDFIVLNSLNDSGAGFQHDTNKISILDKHGHTKVYPLKSKIEVAHDIINYLMEYSS